MKEKVTEWENAGLRAGGTGGKEGDIKRANVRGCLMYRPRIESRRSQEK